MKFTKKQLLLYIEGWGTQTKHPNFDCFYFYSKAFPNQLKVRSANYYLPSDPQDEENWPKSVKRLLLLLCIPYVID